MLLRGSLDYTGVFYFMRVSVFMHTYTCVPCMCPVCVESEESIESPGTGQFDLPYGSSARGTNVLHR